MIKKVLSTTRGLLKLSFYVGLGGVSALASACGGTQSPAGDGGQDADAGVHDTGADSAVDGGADAVADGAADADQDAAADAGRDAAADADKDGSSDADMWDVVYE